MKRFLIAGFVFLMNLLVQAQDSTVVKYFPTALNRSAILKKAVPFNEIRGRSHFRAVYSAQGDLQSIEFIAGEGDLEPLTVSTPTTEEEPKPFVPLTPEQQADMNPDNRVMQEALYGARWKGKLSPAPRKEEEVTPEEISVETKDLSDTTATPEQPDVAPPEVLAVFQMEAPKPTQDSLVIRGSIRQRILTAEPGGIRYFRRWKVRTGELFDPIPAAAARGRHYRAYFDENGILDRVTFFNKRGRRSWSYHLERDSTGIYRSYSIEFHRKQPLMVLDKHLFAPDLSELRPGWKARYEILDSGRPKSVSVYDKYGNFYYYYAFRYQTEGDSTDFYTIITSDYYHADSSKVGSHKLFFKNGSALEKIEFYNQRGALIRTEEYQYDPDNQEVILTIRNRKGKVMQRRLLPYGEKGEAED